MKKSTFLFIAICLATLVQAQLQFEEVTVIEDCSLTSIQVSPIGEYFATVLGQGSSIYSSLDGIEFIEEEVLTDFIDQYQLEFLEDGTPFLISNYANILSRKNGQWENFNPNGSWQSVDNVFVNGNTLYYLRNNTIYSSNDNGVTSEIHLNLDSSNSTLKDFIVYQDYTVCIPFFDNKVFVYQGQELIEEFSISSFDRLEYNGTNEVAILGLSNKVNLLNLDNLTLVENPIILFSMDQLIASAKYYYHIKEDFSIYRSTKLTNNSWEFYTTVPDNIDLESLSVDIDENLYGFKINSNILSSYNVGDQSWTSDRLPLNKPFIYNFDELKSGRQFVNTPNGFFRKNEMGTWDHDENINQPILNFETNQFNELFINCGDKILYSADGSSNYESISVPEGPFGNAKYILHVLDYSILVLINDDFGDSYYSTDNGLNWNPVNPGFFSNSTYGIKLLGDKIYIVENDFGLSITKINITTGFIENESVNGFSNNFADDELHIQEDGTIIFSGNFNGDFGLLLSYHPNTGIQEVISLSDLFPNSNRVLIDNSIYTFDMYRYQELTDGILTLKNVSGLPSGSHEVSLSNSGHLLSVSNNSELLRSTTQFQSHSTISGSLKFDKNSNCIEEEEDKLYDYHVEIKNDELYRLLNINPSTGEYKTYLPSGNYTVTTFPPNELWKLCEESYEVTLEEDQDVSQNFYSQALVDCSSLALDFSTPFLRRCFDNVYHFHLINNGTLDISQAEVKIQLDSYFIVSSISYPYVDLGDNLISLSIEDLAIGERLNFNVKFNLSCAAELGQIHCVSSSIDINTPCNLDDRLGEIECQENIGAYDPNDKRCFNEEGLETDQFDLDEYLYYHIRFQNTGTDTAFNIKVYDPLSEKFELSTFEMLSSSHDNEYLITDGPQLEVYFDNILLPDSTTNLLESNGYFKFRIKPLAEYVYGESFENQAAIYFDFNEPIFTNETTTTLTEIVSTQSESNQFAILINPNPTQDIFTLTLDSKQSGSSQISIYNDQGQLMTTQTSDQQKVQFDSSQYPVGVYVVKVQVGDAVVSRKLVVVR